MTSSVAGGFGGRRTAAVAGRPSGRGAGLRTVRRAKRRVLYGKEGEGGTARELGRVQRRSHACETAAAAARPGAACRVASGGGAPKARGLRHGLPTLTPQLGVLREVRSLQVPRPLDYLEQWQGGGSRRPRAPPPPPWAYPSFTAGSGTRAVPPHVRARCSLLTRGWAGGTPPDIWQRAVRHVLRSHRRHHQAGIRCAGAADPAALVHAALSSLA